MRFFNNSWDTVLDEEFNKDYFKKLIEKVADEYNNYTVYPDEEKVFSALKMTPFDKTKVVIIGQDPYHGKGQAHGACFSVMPGVAVPPSLVNIYKEIVADVGGFIPNNGYLGYFAKQGVLLLNSVLTVRANQPASHSSLGWQTFTDAVIQSLNKSDKKIVFLLWGRHAKEKEKLIDTSRHAVLSAAHPSPFSAYDGFFGCKHFSKTNKILTENGETPIDWQIPDV